MFLYPEIFYLYHLDSDSRTVLEMSAQELKVLDEVLVGDVVHLIRAVFVPCVAKECVEDEDDADGPDEPVQALSVLHESLVPHRDVVEVAKIEVETLKRMQLYAKFYQIGSVLQHFSNLHLD